MTLKVLNIFSRVVSILQCLRLAEFLERIATRAIEIRHAFVVSLGLALISLPGQPVQAQQTCPCSIWTSTTAPGPMASDANAVELGVKFRADSNGFITGLRFEKYAQNSGTHVGSLWTTGGTLLGDRNIHQ